MLAVDTNVLVRWRGLEVARKAGQLHLVTYDKALGKVAGAQKL